MTKVINLRSIKRKNNKLYDKNNLFNYNLKLHNKDVLNIIFTIVSMLAIFLGCIIYKNNQIIEVNDVCVNFIKQIHNDTFFNIFLSYIKIDIIYYIVLFFLGSSLLGVPLTFIPIILKCVFIGYLSTLVYCEYELNGILFCLVLLFPIFSITTASLIYAANESIYMSKYTLDLVKNKNTANNVSVRLYLIKYGFLCCLNLIAIAINSLLALALANKFNLF